MRVRTDDRRNAIIDVAIEIFRTEGFERASMAAIAARVGGSKATLYSYFKSKEALFAAAMMAVMEGQADEAMALLDKRTSDVASVLRHFGAVYLGMVTSADTLSVMRTAIAEGANSELGKTLYQCSAERAWRQMGEYLADLQSRGVLQNVRPRISAAHFKGLLETGLVEPLLFGAPAWFDEEEAVASAVDAFLKIYSAEKTDRA